MQLSEAIEWLYKEPGPALLIKPDLFKQWKATEGSSTLAGKSDFDRAAAVRKRLEMLPVGKGECLLLNFPDSVHLGWSPLDPAGGLLIVCSSDDEPTLENIQQILSLATPKDWKNTKFVYENRGLELTLVDAGETTGTVQYGTLFGALDLFLDTGTYKLMHARYAENADVYHFLRFGPAQVKAGPAQRANAAHKAKQKMKKSKMAQAAPLILKNRDEAGLLGENRLRRMKRWTDEMITDALAFLHATTSPNARNILVYELERREESMSGAQIAELVAFEVRERLQDPSVLPAYNLNEWLRWQAKTGGFTGFDPFISRNSPVEPAVLTEYWQKDASDQPLVLTRLQILKFRNPGVVRLLIRALFCLDGIAVRANEERFYDYLLELMRSTPELEWLKLDLPKLTAFFTDVDEALQAIARKLGTEKIPATLDARNYWARLLLTATPEFKVRARQDSAFWAMLQQQHHLAAALPSSRVNLEYAKGLAHTLAPI